MNSCRAIGPLGLINRQRYLALEVVATFRHHHSKLGEQAPHLIDQTGAGMNLCGPDAVQAKHGLLLDALDRDKARSAM